MWDNFSNLFSAYSTVPFNFNIKILRYNNAIAIKVKLLGEID